MNFKKSFTLLLTATICLSTTVFAATQTIEIEAEYAFQHGSTTQVNTSASNKQVVGNLGGESYVRFSFNMDTALNYNLTIYYINGDNIDRGARIYVNNSFFRDQKFMPSGSWGNISSITIMNIPFQQGLNYVDIKGGSSISYYAPDIDKVVASIDSPNSTSYPNSTTLPTQKIVSNGNTYPLKTGRIGNLNTSCNVRIGPDTSYASLGQIRLNTQVNVYEEQNGWSRIDYSNSYAWVSNKYLITQSSNNSSSNIVSNGNIYPLKTGRIGNLNTSCNVRVGPDTSYASLGQIRLNTQVNVYEERNGWSRIDYSNSYAWVSNKYLITQSSNNSSSNISANRAVSKAEEYLRNYGVNSMNRAYYSQGEKRASLDKPYKDGKRYCDCSSFVWFCYKAQNIYIEDKKYGPTTVANMHNNPGQSFQKKSFTRIDELKPGDLIMWLNYDGRGNNHVAIYTGDGYAIDSSSSQNGISKRKINKIVKSNPKAYLRLK